MLLLGYRKEMEAFLRRGNPGLARRFQLEHAFEFDDYDDQALLRRYKKEIDSLKKKLRYTSAGGDKDLEICQMINQMESLESKNQTLEEEKGALMKETREGQDGRSAGNEGCEGGKKKKGAGAKHENGFMADGALTAFTSGFSNPKPRKVSPKP